MTDAQDIADDPLRGRLRVRAEVQVAPAARLRSQQRLQRRLHGLVPLSVLLLLQVSRTRIAQIFLKPTIIK